MNIRLDIQKDFPAHGYAQGQPSKKSWDPGRDVIEPLKVCPAFFRKKRLCFIVINWVGLVESMEKENENYRKINCFELEP